MAAESGSFSPSSLSKVSAWLRHTQTSLGLAQWTSMLDGNHATQATGARQPTAGTSATNARPISTWVSANNSAMVFPLSASTNGATKVGFATHIRQPTSANEAIVIIGPGTNGASGMKFRFFTQTSRRLMVDAFLNNTDGRRATTAVNALPAAGTWAFVLGFFDGDGATETDEFQIWIDGVQQGSLVMSNLGAGGDVETMPTPTLNGVIGNINDGVSSLGFNGDKGQNMYSFSSLPTAQEQVLLSNFERPT